jgi:hypothetical protein
MERQRLLEEAEPRQRGSGRTWLCSIPISNARVEALTNTAGGKDRHNAKTALHAPFFRAPRPMFASIVPERRRHACQYCSGGCLFGVPLALVGEGVCLSLVRLCLWYGLTSVVHSTAAPPVRILVGLRRKPSLHWSVCRDLAWRCMLTRPTRCETGHNCLGIWLAVCLTEITNFRLVDYEHAVRH